MVKEPDRPWGEIIHIYDRPLREEDIFTTFHTSREIVEETKLLMTVLQQAIDRTVEAMGYKGATLMTLGSEIRDNRIGARIKQDTDWKQAYAQLVALHAPGMNLEESAQHLTRTDWNSLQFGLLGLAYENRGLKVDAAYSHSYFDTLSGQRTPEGSLRFPQLKKFDPMSVAGFTITSDDFLVLGYRGGTNFQDTIHYLPVGSVEPHTEQNPLYESQDKENSEETGLIRDRWYHHPKSGLATIVKDIQPHRSYAIFEQHLDIDLNGLIDLWRTNAEEKDEYRHLVPLPNDPDFVLEEIKRKMFDFEKARLPLSRTSGVNYGAILPQCAIGLLAVYTRNLGLEWARHTESYLQGRFDLTSCFDRR